MHKWLKIYCNCPCLQCSDTQLKSILVTCPKRIWWLKKSVDIHLWFGVIVRALLFSLMLFSCRLELTRDVPTITLLILHECMRDMKIPNTWECLVNVWLTRKLKRTKSFWFITLWEHFFMFIIIYSHIVFFCFFYF